jgi:two-component system, NarL family, nitrate/nitrite response regulator NarL
MTIRLVLADDHPVVLDGLVHLFSAEGDFEILARAHNGGETLRAVRQLHPDILVLDLRMPGMDGFTVLREMRREGLSTKVVVLTAMEGEATIDAIHLGVRGVISKDIAMRVLVQCVREVHAGRKWLDGGVAARAVERLLRREAGIRMIERTLTRRELEVARLIADGMSSKAVARNLAISEGTAKLHLHHVYEKLKLRGRVALLRYIHTHGID